MVRANQLPQTGEVREIDYVDILAIFDVQVSVDYDR